MAPANIVKNGLPPPALGIIGDIEKAIKVLSRAATGKDKVCEYIYRSVSLGFEFCLFFFTHIGALLGAYIQPVCFYCHHLLV